MRFHARADKDVGNSAAGRCRDGSLLITAPGPPGSRKGKDPAPAMQKGAAFAAPFFLTLLEYGRVLQK